MQPSLLRQVGGAHQEAVAFASRTAAFVDGPDDEGLSAADIAGGEDSGNIGREGAVFGFDVGSGVSFEGKLVDHSNQFRSALTFLIILPAALWLERTEFAEAGLWMVRRVQ